MHRNNNQPIKSIKMFSTKNLLTALAVATTLSLASCKDAAKEKEKMAADSTAAANKVKATADSTAAAAKAVEDAKPKSLVDLATAATPTLAKALEAAGLVEMVGKETLTVFAPSDAAFAAIQKDVDELLKPENKAKLVALLQNHVVKGAVMAADLKDGQEVTMANGKKVKVSVKDGKVMIGTANVTQPDVKASNGVVHLIDAVIK